MTAPSDSLLTVQFEVLGRALTNLTSWSIQSAYMVSADAFEFVAVDIDRTKLQRLELQPVELFVNGASQMLGRIERTSVGDKGLAVTFQGRDYVADIVEGNVDPLIKIKSGDTVSDAFLRAAGPYGIDTLFDDADVSMRDVRTGINVKVGKGGKGYAKRILREYKPKPGEGVYEYLNRLIARLGATMQPGPTRNSLVVTQPRYDQEAAYTLTRTDDAIGSARNNVLSSSASRDYSTFPSYCMANGWQANGGQAPVNASVEVDAVQLVAGEGELADIIGNGTAAGRIKPGDDTESRLGAGRLYRLLYIKDDEARTQEQVEFAAKRAIAERLRPTLEYHATVKGHVDPRSGAVWSVDTIVQVEDAICGVSENLWISERTLRYSSEGATTDIVAVRPGSFTFG